MSQARTEARNSPDLVSRVNSKEEVGNINSQGDTENQRNNT